MIRTLRAAAAFVHRAGLATAFPIDDLVLPSLWEAAVGTREVTVFRIDNRGKRVLTDELAHVWSLKNRLAAERLACVGKHVHNRVALVSFELLPALYALTSRPGRADDFRDAELSSLERELAEALLHSGPLTSPEARALVGALDAKATKRALERLQRLLVVTHAGEAEQAQGWDAAVFDLLARRYAEHIGSFPRREEALSTLAERVLRSVGDVSAADLGAVLGVRRRVATQTLDALVDRGVARRRDGADFSIWSPTRTPLFPTSAEEYAR